MHDEIQWICDACNKEIPQGEAIRPNPNKYQAYHKSCYNNSFK